MRDVETAEATRVNLDAADLVDGDVLDQDTTDTPMPPTSAPSGEASTSVE
jgi:hypothetical protein